MASSSILSNNPIAIHTTTAPAVNGTKPTSTKSLAHLTRKRSYETALTTHTVNTAAVAIEIDSLEEQQNKSMKPPTSTNDLMSTVEHSTNTAALKDFTRTISQHGPDDAEENGADPVAKIVTEHAASPVKKKYVPPKSLQNLPSVSSGSSDIQVSAANKTTFLLLSNIIFPVNREYNFHN